MKSLPAGLQARLDTGTTTLAWCWRIARRDGVVLGFTDHDRSLTFGGTEFEPESGFAASELRAGVDLAVDAQDAEGVLSSDCGTAWNVDPVMECAPRTGQIGRLAIDRWQAF